MGTLGVIQACFLFAQTTTKKKTERRFGESGSIRARGLAPTERRYTEGVIICTGIKLVGSTATWASMRYSVWLKQYQEIMSTKSIT